jgi:hypothetical protein
VAGGILRATYRFSYNHKIYWHIALFLFVLGVLIVLDYFMPMPIFLGIFGAPQAILALWQLYQVEKSGKNKRRWAGYTTLLAICIGVDLGPEGITIITQFIHCWPSIGLTGLLPPLYLFIMWIQPGNSFLTKENFLTVVDKSTPEVVKKWDSNSLYTNHPKLIKLSLVALLEGTTPCSASSYLETYTFLAYPYPLGCTG